MSRPLPSPKSRLRPVYSVPEEPLRRSESVLYQLEDVGHPVLRLRPSLRIVAQDAAERYLYRVEAYSRLTGRKYGQAELIAPEGSSEEFAAMSRQFQSAPFRRVVEGLSAGLVESYAEIESGGGTIA